MKKTLEQEIRSFHQEHPGYGVTTYESNEGFGSDLIVLMTKGDTQKKHVIAYMRFAREKHPDEIVKNILKSMVQEFEEVRKGQK